LGEIGERCCGNIIPVENEIAKTIEMADCRIILLVLINKRGGGGGDLVELFL
jgi:hypothetical protein